MKHESHKWSLDTSPPVIRAHSLTKHRVLGLYLERYVSTLTRNIRIEQLPITVVDAFAGGNVYRHWETYQELPGSPSIILEAMETAAKEAKALRKKGFNLDGLFFFIEKDPDAYQVLKRTLTSSRFQHKIEKSIILINDDFNNHWESVVKKIESRKGSGRSIFVFDQCGYTDVPFNVIDQILKRLENSEVILTFATDFLIDYLRQNDQKNVQLSKLGISLPSRGNTSQNSKAETRRGIQLVLHQEIRNKTNAKFYTPFFIRCRDSNKAFWLIHLSNHFKARDVMVQLHWELNNCFAHYGGSGLKMLGYDPNWDISLVGPGWLPGFFFDETARRSTAVSLHQELPIFLRNYFPNGVSCQNLFSAVTNGTPATISMIKNAAKDLAVDGTLSVRDVTGNTRRRKGVQENSDIILLERQKRFFFFDSSIETTVNVSDVSSDTHHE